MTQNERFYPTGLTDEEVQQRVEQGAVNVTGETITRTTKQIVHANVFTFFNFINIVLFTLTLSVGSVKNMFFILVAAINTVVGIVQEMRSKKILDELSILTASKAIVIRNGEKQEIPIEEIVLDDLIVLKNGDQIPSDGIVIQGTIEANESLLTGESDSIIKEAGADIFSGSFVTAGKALCKVTHVGKDNYTEQIVKEAKQFKKHNSELRNCIDKILKVISVIIVPVGVGLFLEQFFVNEIGYRDSVLSTVSAVLGMIPEGLVLLTSVALTLGVIRLAQRKTLVQELYCIETLARVDVLCLDKTGTITEGNIYLEDVEVLDGRIDVDEIMGNMMGALTDDNATFQALQRGFPVRQTMEVDHIIPFSSDRKYSGVSFRGEGTYLVGAVQFLFPEGYEQLKEIVASHAEKGYRILVLSHSPNEIVTDKLPQRLEPCAILMLTDVVREEAPETLAFFEEQGVTLKVISGDDPRTVSAVAAKAGLKHADQYVDAATLETEEDLAAAVREYNVFGRVTPGQKRKMIRYLKAEGHTVAMTGDGVNDVLALKEADCSVVMASGSDAAKHAANLVLLDSNFASMPHIVNEGRRVINNIRNAASMFLIKTMFSVILAILSIILVQRYPFEPIQLSVISGCAVGIPTFLLQKEPTFEKVGKHFLRKVFRLSFPPAVVIALSVFLVNMIGPLVGCDAAMTTSVSVLTTGWIYMLTLNRVYSPMTLYRRLVTYGMRVLYLLCMGIGQKLLELSGMNLTAVIMMLAVITFAPIAIEGADELWKLGFKKWQQKRRLSNVSILDMDD